ncbi:MAG: hypothetical protein JXB49_14560 [Bacteroidales bacterium]|nr:hypothetical protein [Bacteroidales bacterium]
MKTLKTIIAFLYNFYKSTLYTRKIRKIYKSVNFQYAQFDKTEIKAHQNRWKSLHSHINPTWYEVYAIITGKRDPNFVPEDVYYNIIEPRLNNKQLSKGYSDKNLYDTVYDARLLPKTILRNIDGVFYNEKYEFVNISSDSDLLSNLIGNEEIIIKPSMDSGGGRDVKLFSSNNGRYVNSENQTLTLDYLYFVFKRNFIIQEKIQQHTFFMEFNKTSVNTIRVFTYRSVLNNSIEILHTLLRIGKANSITDNQASGGLSCGITNGRINSYAVDKYGNKYENVNNIDLNTYLEIPFYNEILNHAKDIANRNYYAHLLGLDFCIDVKGDVRLIEINNVNNEINFYQMNNGPLFGRFTNEIIDYCTKNQASYMFDFTI